MEDQLAALSPQGKECAAQRVQMCRVCGRTALRASAQAELIKEAHNEPSICQVNGDAGSRIPTRIDFGRSTNEGACDKSDDACGKELDAAKNTVGRSGPAK